MFRGVIAKKEAKRKSNIAKARGSTEEQETDSSGMLDQSANSILDESGSRQLADETSPVFVTLLQQLRLKASPVLENTTAARCFPRVRPWVA